MLVANTYYPAETEIMFEIEYWQNPSVYLVFEFFIYTIWQEETDVTGVYDDYYIDKYRGFYVDLTDAAPITKL